MIRSPRHALSILAAGLLLAGASTATAAETGVPSFRLGRTVPLGGSDHWDYLLFDQASHRLLVDADNGRTVASEPIGRGSDAVVFDPKRKIVFSSNGEGSLSMIAERGADSFVALPPVQTAPGARTMALDAETGRVFLVTADLDNTQPATERRKFLPGTVKLLVLDPQ